MFLQQVTRYLNEGAYSRIVEMETEQGTALDDTYRQMMIDDIQKANGASITVLFIPSRTISRNHL
ncbi:hypothetical protein GCM10020331_080190 [Ectobacillus funiculus]